MGSRTYRKDRDIHAHPYADQRSVHSTSIYLCRSLTGLIVSHICELHIDYENRILLFYSCLIR